MTGDSRGMASGAVDAEGQSTDGDTNGAEEENGNQRLGLANAVRAAVEQFASLTGRQPEGVTGVKATDSGWSALVDVVELERIPGSTSVLATYRVDLDQSGDVTSYERMRRFVRGAVDPT